MAQSEEHYRAAAHSLGEGFLGSKFGQSNLDEPEVSKIHRVEAFKENAILLAGDRGSIAGVIDRGAQATQSIQNTMSAKAKKARQSASNFLFLDLMDQASRYAAQLAADVARIEAGYEAQYGDAWVETIALEVLGPDEIPEREDGESITDYRERVRETLLDQMIDPNSGDVRPEYADSPHANWAERAWKHEKVDAQMDIATDESRPQAEREAAVQEVIETGRHDDAAYAITSFEAGDREYAMLDEALDEIRDDATVDSGAQADWDSLLAP